VKHQGGDATRQAVHLAPDQIGWYENLAMYALASQRFDEARQIIHQRIVGADYLLGKPAMSSIFADQAKPNVASTNGEQFPGRVLILDD
jgi:hypothetical protein